ncbi:25117_t:CDS:2 [Cetraspora pellucida]|uniref:Autophagy-related protein 14 n=1 Tax=Cetraspora pellucida TaxID=1433469 RepID=A0A9N9DSZ1_9GLOM|nr:25117_t:CDS:2 [Cetraspora pellucida]
MECQICHNFHRKFWCANCIRERLHSYKVETNQITYDKQKKVDLANNFLSGTMKNIQVNLAEKHTKVQKVNILELEISKIREEIARDRQEVDKLKRNLKTRREVLQESLTYFKKFKSHQQALITKDIDNTKERWQHVHKILAHSRKVLIGELVSLFDLKRVSSQENHIRIRENDGMSENGHIVANSIGDDCEHAIAGITLPKKHCIRHHVNDRERKEEEIIRINTAVGHVMHMIGLIAFYLGIKLPFLVINKGYKSFAKGSIHGIPISKRPLYLTDRNSEDFTVGMAMLNYNIAYLCHTQGVDIPHTRISHTLQNLFLCCQAANLGRMGHLTALNRIFDQSFSLDFEDVVRRMFVWINGNGREDSILRFNIPGALYDYFEEDIDDDNENMDGETWVLCDTV